MKLNFDHIHNHQSIPLTLKLRATSLPILWNQAIIFIFSKIKTKGKAIYKVNLIMLIDASE